MREKERIDRILKKIEKIWKLNPDWRLGQLISNVTYRGAEQHLWTMEDDALEKLLDSELG